MADIVISVVGKAAEYLVKPAILEGKYFLCANKVIEDLKSEKEELKSERDCLQGRVDRATERAEEIEEPVQKWLNDVNDILEKAADLEQRTRANNNCFQGWCPTWRRYRLCRKMAKEIEAMGKFKGKSDIQPFSYPAPLPGIQYESSEGFTYFETTKLAYDQLLQALQDDSLYLIGVYGMAGSGKTTLVTEVGKKALELNLFDKVLSITVSQTPNIKEIQGKLAGMLNMKLEEEYEEERAQRLWMSLKQKKRVLIIVDDLWGELMLSKIGICLDNDYRGRWKVLVTTRRREVCVSMDCQKNIQLSLLSEHESWTLFKVRANIDDSFSKLLDDVPRKICDECERLPIAIVTVGCSLKGKCKAEWQVALHSLKHSEAIDDYVQGGVGATFKVLKWSYDYLENSEEKLLFLICSLFPEDYEIKIEELIRYAIGLGLGGRHSLESARSRIELGLNKLIDCSLLMQDEESKEYVNMHDLFRDLALWIAKRSEDHKILVNLDKPIGTLAEDVNVGDYFAVSSWFRENQIPLQWDAPNLQIMLLDTGNEDSMDLSEAKFEGTTGLKVLSVINKYWMGRSLLLPQSIKLLTNLQTLCLNNWFLGDISFIVYLTRLEVLQLERCSFNNLPNEMRKLKRLKLLDLSECLFEDRQYNGALQECAQLEELYFTGCYPRQYFTQSLVDIATLPNLHRFVIHSNNMSCYMMTDHIKGSRRVLELYDVDILKIGASKKNLLQTAEIVILHYIDGGGKNLIPDMIGILRGMNDLSSLYLYHMLEIECIFDTTSYLDQTTSRHELGALIPKLVELELRDSDYLTELCRGPPQQVLHFFEKLIKLRISNCLRLHSIFPPECNLRNLKILIIENTHDKICFLGEALFSMSAARSLQQLEELAITACDGLKQVIASGGEHSSNTSNEIVPARRNSYSMMPNLKTVLINRCLGLKFIFPVCCVEDLPRLEKIQINYAPKLEFVFGECDHQDHSSHQHDEKQVMFPRLEVIFLVNLESLTRICPENYHVKWLPPKLYVKRCPKLNTWTALMIGSEQKHHMMNEGQLGKSEDHDNESDESYYDNDEVFEEGKGM